MRTAIVSVATIGLLAASCGQDPSVSVDTHAGALDAIADSFSQSWAWQGRLDVDIAEADLAGLDEQDRRDVEELERFDDAYAEGALGDDGSWRTALVDDDTTWLDLRLEVGEVLAAETLEPDASLYLKLDIPYMVQSWGAGFVTVDELRDDARQWLDDSPFLDVALAVLDGNWGGLTGTLDLADMGVTDEDLAAAREEFRQELIGVADRATMLELLDEATTLRDFERTQNAGSVATLDVHPRDAAFAVYDLFDDAEWVAAGHTSPEELPETLSGVATVTFDRDGMVTEVVTDVLAVAREIHEHDPESGAEELAELSADSTVEVVFSFAEHGQVPTVLDLPDAVTADWGELADFFASWWHVPDHSEGVEVPDGDVEHDLDAEWESEIEEWESEWDEVQELEDLEELEAELETKHDDVEEPGTRPDDAGELDDEAAGSSS